MHVHPKQVVTSNIQKILSSHEPYLSHPMTFEIIISLWLTCQVSYLQHTGCIYMSKAI